MVSPKPEDMLHTYLRRYFERISNGMTRRFAEQKDVPCLKINPDRLPAGGGSSVRAPQSEIAPLV
jgi:hypothetical protein